MIITFNLDLLSRLLIPLIASFSGAGFAFLLNDRAKARQTIHDQVTAVNQAQFTLIMRLNELKNFQAQIIEPFRQDLNYFIAMRPSPPLQSDAPIIPLDSLMFLLETDDHHLLFELMVEQQRFKTTVQAINERSRIHIDKVQPCLAAAGIREETRYSTPLEQLLGEPLYKSIVRATDDAVKSVDESSVSCESLIRRLYSAMKKRYPKYSIVHLD